MMERMRSLMPRARQHEVVVEELPDETLVYDLKRHRAHCLNPTSALVWQNCDGRTTMAEAAGILEDKLGVPRGDEMVRLALYQLQKAKLLEEGVNFQREPARFARREVVRKLVMVGGASILLPLITSIKAPLAAQAGSTTTATDCKLCQGIGLPCSDRPGRICTLSGNGKCKCR